MRSLRQWHQYLSLFFAPAIFVFALSGFIQVTGFHESHPGSSYQPPAWVVALASIHQHQTLGREHRDQDRGGKAPAGPNKKQPPRDRDGSGFVFLKPFVLLMALGLMVTSVFGVTIALNNPLRRKASLIVLIAGTILPIVLLLV